MNDTTLARPRQCLPQLADEVFLTDGGIETTLIYHQGMELPHFAAFVLLDDDAGARRCAATSSRTCASLPTPDWASSSRPRRGGPAATGARAGLLARRPWPTPTAPRSSCSKSCARDYATADVPVVHQRLHRPARRRLPARVADDARRGGGLPRRADRGRSRETAADLVTAITMTHTGEAIGIARAAAGARPARVSSRSPWRPTAGCRPGRTLGEAITDGRRGDRRRAGLLHGQLRASRRTWTRR